MDIALAYDAASGCDVVFDGRDFAIDTTPRSLMLATLGTDRRARADDVLPDGEAPFTTPTTLVARRGWAGDTLDALGRRFGSRLWLLKNAKATEATRRFAENAVREAFATVETATLIFTVVVRWIGPAGVSVQVPTHILGIQVSTGDTTLSLQRTLA